MPLETLPSATKSTAWIEAHPSLNTTKHIFAWARELEIRARMRTSWPTSSSVTYSTLWYLILKRSSGSHWDRMIGISPKKAAHGSFGSFSSEFFFAACYCLAARRSAFLASFAAFSAAAAAFFASCFAFFSAAAWSSSSWVWAGFSSTGFCSYSDIVFEVWWNDLI